MTDVGPQDSPTWPPVAQPSAAPPSAVPPSTTAASTAQPSAAPYGPYAPQDRIEPAVLPASPPIPPGSPVTSGRQRPRHPRRIAGAAIVGGVLLAGTGMAVGWGGGGDHRVSQHQIVSRQLTALTVDGSSGKVRIRSGASPGTVEVTRTGPSGQNPTLVQDETWTGTTLAITPACGSCDVDYDIRVPDGVGVTAHTGSGDIQLDGTLGGVSLQAGSGDVDADVTTTSLASRTGSGDTSLRLRTPPALVSATTGSGDVEIRLPGGDAYAVETQSSSGDKEVDVQQQSTSEHRVEVVTGSGDIRLRDE